MYHGAYIRLINPHAEGDGGHQHGDIVVQEGILQALALVGGESGVVVGGGVAQAAQFAGQPFGFLAGAAVYDGREIAGAAQKIEQGGHALLHRAADAGDIRPVGRQDDAVLRGYAEGLAEVLLHARGGGSGEGQGGMRAQLFLQGRELQVIRSEAVPPFGDAVGFIHHQQGEGGCCQCLPQFAVLH